MEDTLGTDTDFAQIDSNRAFGIKYVKEEDLVVYIQIYSPDFSKLSVQYLFAAKLTKRIVIYIR